MEFTIYSIKASGIMTTSDPLGLDWIVTNEQISGKDIDTLLARCFELDDIHGFADRALKDGSEFYLVKTQADQKFVAIAELAATFERDQIITHLLRNFGVRPETRNKGIGRHLITMIRNRHVNIAWEVNENNIIALRFYRKLDWAVELEDNLWLSKAIK